jgi:ADP-dependent NAD(P)H-hydrate dehydratase / NAD(P)H-hydrate epimerase
MSAAPRVGRASQSRSGERRNPGPTAAYNSNMNPGPSLPPIYRTAELRVVEAAAGGEPLMERAGHAAARVAQAISGERGGAVLVLAGPGNNGGDAFVVARYLRAWFHDVAVVFRADAAKLPPDAAAAHAAFRAAGGTTIGDIPSGWNGELIVDGLFGIGLARPLSAEYAALVERANAMRAPILALDVPSGLSADTGALLGPTIRATATATFIALKPGLLTGDGVDACGDLSVHRLELDPEAIAPAPGHRLDWSTLARSLPPVLARRERNVHKGSFGTLGVIGGADGMVGAPLLAGRAALKLGAGRVVVGFAAREHPAVDWGAPELMLRPAAAVLAAMPDALVIGPGFGADPGAADLLAHALATAIPIALDADALNLVAGHPLLRAALAARAAATVLTPHPAEAARLLATDTASIQRDRLEAALTLARELQAHVVLKGAGSVLAHPDASWDINASGSCALATAGSGDVLAGLVGALLAQGIDAKTALRYAVCLHGAAADALVSAGTGPLGVVASELPNAARALVNAAARK